MEITLHSAHYDLRRVLRAGALAALTGGITVELFLFTVHAASWPGTYQWVASGIFGKAAFTAVSYAWVGVAIHSAVSLFWGLLYAAAASKVKPLRDKPVGSGLLYGLIVFAFMQAVTLIAQIWSPPSAQQLCIYLIDHALFFGLPVALVAKAALAGAGRSYARNPQRYP